MCGCRKTLEAFHACRKGKDGKQARCKECDKHIYRIKKARKINPPGKTKVCNICKIDKQIAEFYTYISSSDGIMKECAVCHRERRRLCKYKLTKPDVIDMLEKCNYGCEICTKSIDFDTCHIDHCHETKNIRGLLCAKCNLGIGLFCDNVEIMKSAIKYIKKKV